MVLSLLLGNVDDDDDDDDDVDEKRKKKFLRSLSSYQTQTHGSIGALGIGVKAFFARG